MNFGRFAYLFTDLVFAGSALLIIWHRHTRFLKKHWEFVFDFTLFALPFAYFDTFALKWGAWSYNPQRNFHFFVFGEEIEGYIFMALVAAAVASYTIASAKVYGYRKTNPHHQKHKQRKSKPRRVLRVVGAAKH